MLHFFTSFLFIQRKRLEREFDPVSMTYTNPLKEANFQSKQENRLEFLKTNYHNLSNNIFPSATTSSFGSSSPNPPPPCSGTPFYSTDRNYKHPYNILTNYSNNHHEQAPFMFEEDYYLKYNKKVIEKASAAAVTASSSSGPFTRTYNIISNKEKSKESEELLNEKTKKINQILLKKYYEKNNYNLILNKFTNEENERKSIEDRKKELLLKNLRQKNSQTISNKISEGSIYNIINNKDKLLPNYELYKSHGLFDKGPGENNEDKNDFELNLLKQSVLYNKACDRISNSNINKIKKSKQVNNIILNEEDIKNDSLNTTMGSTINRDEKLLNFNIINNIEIERQAPANHQWNKLNSTNLLDYNKNNEIKFDKTYCSIDNNQNYAPNNSISTHSNRQISNSARNTPHSSKPSSRAGTIPSLDLKNSLVEPSTSSFKSQFSVRTGGFN